MKWGPLPAKVFPLKQHSSLCYVGFCDQMESSEWDERDGRLRHEGMWSSAAGVVEIQLIARKGLSA